MNILIPDNEPTVEVTFETKQAPCPGCRFYSPGAENRPTRCTVEDRALSDSVVKDCARFGWRQES